MYDVIGYKETGFNLENVPGSRALLDTCPAISLDATDVMQQDFLSSLTVYANWETISGIDYLTISDACYIVTGITMTSPDVCVLSLQYDALASLGGAEIVGTSALPILDGYTSRVCVSDDTYGAHTGEEPFTPAQPLKLVKGALMGDSGGAVSTYVLSTVDLTDTGTTATTYTSSASEGAAVTIPSLKNSGGSQAYYMQTPSDTDGNETVAYTPGTRLYDGENATVKQQIQRARECGLDAGILGQYCIPDAYHSHQDLNGLITNIKGTMSTSSSGLPLKYAVVSNQKALTGTLNRYYLVSMGTGDSAEYKPEDIQDGGDAPSFVIYADPRYQQKPYCRPKSYLGDATQPYLQALPGQVWADTPLRYESKSGSALDAMKYDAEQITQQNANWWTNAEAVNGKAGGGVVSGIAAGLKDLGRFAQYKAMNFFGAGQSNYTSYTAQDIDSMATYYTAGDWAKTKQEQKNAANMAALTYGSGQTVAPSISFPRSDTMRDYFGNGFQIYRYRLTDTDLKRYDQYLTMYGYAEVKPLEAQDFTCRKYFNYVLCSTVSLGGSAPRWKREAAADQLRAGVRVWHKLPDTTIYVSGNPIKA